MRRYLLLAVAAVACPCHLPITIPLLVALLGGTALGSVVAGQEGWLLGVGGVLLTVIFIGSLGGFIYYATTAGPTPDASTSDTTIPAASQHASTEAKTA